MKIAVLIKQVPQLQDLHLDPETHRLVREGVALEPSSLDMVALGAALAMKDAHGGEVVAITMGPPQAVDVLKAAKLGGADSLILLSDPAFRGSDTLATSRALADLLARNSFDLILLGKRSLDAETGQVGPMLAELLGLPVATGAVAMHLAGDGGRLHVTREVEDGLEDLDLPLPAVVTAAEGLAEEVYISGRKIREAGEVPVTTLGASDIGGDPARYGEEGSPTRVGDIVAVPSRRAGERVGPADRDTVGRAFARFLANRPGPPEEEAPGASYGRDIWVHTVVTTTGIHPTVFELLGKARSLVGPGGRVSALWIGAADETSMVALGKAGADQVLVAAEDVGDPTPDVAADAIAKLVTAKHPGAVLVPSTARGREVASLVAARLGLGLTGDIVDLVVSGDEEGRLIQMKPAFGGAFVAPVTSRAEPDMATVRSGVFQPLAGAHRGSVVTVHTGVSGEGRGVVPRGVKPYAVEADLLRADKVVLGVGMGVGEDHVEEVTALARERGFGLAASRNVTDAGWLPKAFQVGLTGRSIAPDIYLALGISGAFEHLVGLRRARTVVAVNVSEEAPIFQAADFGVVGDWQEVLPVLLDVIAQR